MLTLSRILITAGFLAMLLTTAEPFFAGLIIPFPYLFFLWVRSGEKVKMLILRNVMILVFGLFFSLLVAFSGGLPGYSTLVDIAVMAATILLCYNIVFSGARWVGRRGFVDMTASIPAARLRIFFLLLFAISSRLIRNSDRIVKQLKMRISQGGFSRAVVLKWYFQNLMAKEFYSIHYLQAASVTRLYNDAPLRRERRMPGYGEIMLLLYMSACFTGLLMWGLRP